MLGFETITDFDASRERLARRRYGVIEIESGKLRAIHLRPFPKFVSVVESVWWGRFFHTALAGDHCRLYYNQPWGHARFLALKYIVSSRGCSLASFQAALVVLDEIARLKESDALLCDAANFRLSERIMRYYGWEPHTANRWHRNYIKRFYGVYPEQRRSERVFRRPATELA